MKNAQCSIGQPCYGLNAQWLFSLPATLPTLTLPAPPAARRHAGTPSLRHLLLLALTLLTLLPLHAQPVVEPPLPPPATNTVNTLAPFEAALSLLPYWDKSLTNTFAAGEFTLEAAPVWKTMTAAGTTPYASIGGDYFFTRYLGVGGELITFGNGQGSSSVDSALANLTLRKDIGNIAGYAMIGAGYDFNTGRFLTALGPGITYRYSTGIGIFVDTRWTLEGAARQQNGWLTRVGVQLHF